MATSEGLNWTTLIPRVGLEILNKLEFLLTLKYPYYLKNQSAKLAQDFPNSARFSVKCSELNDDIKVNDDPYKTHFLLIENYESVILNILHSNPETN